MDYKKGIMEQIEQIKSKQVLKFLYELIIAVNYPLSKANGLPASQTS